MTDPGNDNLTAETAPDPNSAETSSSPEAMAALRVQGRLDELIDQARTEAKLLVGQNEVAAPLDHGNVLFVLKYTAEDHSLYGEIILRDTDRGSAVHTVLPHGVRRGNQLLDADQINDFAQKL